MPKPLPAFPVDAGTLDAIEEAIGQAATDDHAAATLASCDDDQPVTETEAQAPRGLTLDGLLEQLSGYVGGGEPAVINGRESHLIPAVYDRDAVILALITEVRTLRASVERWSRSWATAAEALAPDWPQAPA